nr:Chain B, Eukaryotic translation initiation factor 3 subunit J [Homo sapiens]
DEDVKDNWDDD